MDKKVSKAERFAYITKTLVENPSKIFTLLYFSEKLDCAKSTISDDIVTISKNIENFSEGKIISVTGAAGGVYYLPYYSDSKITEISEELSKELCNSTRIISGGYLYMNDIIYDSNWLEKIAKCMISKFPTLDFEYVVTIETKGIPIAVTIARLLNKDIAIVRKDARLTEGATLQMNYVTGSNRSIKTMAIPIKTIKRGSKIIFIDDFMKAGGTSKGVIDLMKEFDVEVVGVSVILSSKEPGSKLVKDYYSLLEVDSIDDNKIKLVTN